jgi:HK97 family phage major capsid protein
MTVGQIAGNDLLNEAHQLKTSAMEVLSNPKASAEDLERAEKMLSDAEGIASRSARLTALRERAGKMAFGAEPALDVKLHGDRVPDETKTFGAHFGKFLTAIKAAEKGRVDPRLSFFESELEAKDLAEHTGSMGGYLVPTEFRPMLMQAVEESSIIRPRAMVIPMTRRTLDVPALKQDGTTAGQPHWFGGMLAFWEAEAATIAETEPAFRNITLTAHELTAVTHVSNNLLNDSAVSLSALLTGSRGFPGVIAWKEDYAFINGSGAGEPLGVLNAGATLGVARTTTSRIKYDDLVNMLGKFMPSGKGVWVASISVKAELMKLAGPTDTGYAGTYLWGNAAAGVPDQLLGMPIIFTEKLPVLGSRGDIGLYDFGHYYVGDRQATTIESSDQARWLKNQTSWKVTHRVDGQPWLNAAFTLADGSTQISPFVVLNA